MSRPEPYNPGPADLAQIRKEGDDWTLVLVKELRHAPDKVWRAMTDPAELREWAPFDADRNLGTVGPAKLTTVGAPSAMVAETEIVRAEAPKTLEFKWGGNDTRWELEAWGEGTRLTLWAKIDRRYIAMGAAGWHVCLDVLDRMLDGAPIGRLVAGDALKSEGWQRLHAEYARRFGVETPKG